MAKSGNKIRKTHSNLTLTPEIAGAICELVKQGNSLFKREQYKTNHPITITVGENVYQVTPHSYHGWITRDVRVPGKGVTLRQMMKDARAKRDELRHRAQQQELIKAAQKQLAILQALPIGTESTLTKTKYRVSKEGSQYVSGIEVEETIMPVDPRMVAIKQKGDHFILERLDPAYSNKNENKNLTVMLSLSDLRKARDEELAKVKPDVDHEQ